jgi:hypothetical protein
MSHATEDTNSVCRGGDAMADKVVKKRSATGSRAGDELGTWCATKSRTCRMGEDLVEMN